MNEYTSRRLIAQAVGATGKIGTEKQFWTTVLTGLNNGVFSSANNEHEFWRKFANHLSNWNGNLADTQTIVSNGDVLPGTGGDFTVVVSGGEVTGGTWAAE